MSFFTLSRTHSEYRSSHSGLHRFPPTCQADPSSGSESASGREPVAAVSWGSSKYLASSRVMKSLAQATLAPTCAQESASAVSRTWPLNLKEITVLPGELPPRLSQISYNN